MKTRKLLDGSRVKEEAASVKMTIDSRCPAKWVFVDLETGDVWRHKDDERFVRTPLEQRFAAATPEQMRALKIVTREES